MALPYFLFENIFANTGAVITCTPAIDTGWPLSNLLDWRTGTAFRARSSSATTSPWDILLDLGSGNSATPNAFAIAGHNFKTAAGAGTFRYNVAWSDDAVSYTNLLGVGTTHVDDMPGASRWTTPSAHRYWRIRFTRLSGSWSSKPSVGVIALGRAMDFTENLPPGFDAYGHRQMIERSINEKGAPIGTNLGAKDRVFDLQYSERGFAVATFFRPATGLTFDTDFVAHALRAGRPFFFVWDSAEEPTGVYLCKVEDDAFESPFMGTTSRRALSMRLRAWREIA